MNIEPYPQFSRYRFTARLLGKFLARLKGPFKKWTSTAGSFCAVNTAQKYSFQTTYPLIYVYLRMTNDTTSHSTTYFTTTGGEEVNTREHLDGG